MPRALGIIRDEHRSIAAVLHGMEYLVDIVRARKARINPRVFSAMLYYLDAFCERYHHPKEDRYLFAPLRRRDPAADAVVSQLENEHAEGVRALRRLEQYFIRYEEGGDKEFPVFARAADEFVRDYFEHMRREETEIFPLVENVFDATDWHVIDTAFADNLDPLAADRDERDMQKLFTRIANLAPPPVGVGPEYR